MEKGCVMFNSKNKNDSNIGKKPIHLPLNSTSSGSNFIGVI